MMKYVLEEELQDRGDAPDIGTSISFLATSLVFMFEAQKITTFPYRKWTLRNRIHDYQANEFKVAASNHKHLLFLFFFLCGAAHAINCCVTPKYHNEPCLLVMRFLIKYCWFIVSNVVLCKIRVVLCLKPPLETKELGIVDLFL